MYYRSIVFLDGDDYNQACEEIDIEDYQALFDYLYQWDYGEGEETETAPWGEVDETEIFTLGKDIFVVSHNVSLGYASLTAIERESPRFDRFDIYEAYYLFFCNYHSGQSSEYYKRSCHMSKFFKPTPSLDFDCLSNNGKEIYLALAEKQPNFNFSNLINQ